MNRAPMTDSELLRLDVDAMNSGLRAYRADLRYTRADAERFAALWNARKLSTMATVANVDGRPVVCVGDAP